MKRVWRSAALAAMVAMPLTGRTATADAAALVRETPPAGAVTALSVVPAAGHADVVIAVDGPAIEIIDFTLENPHRVVVDLKGATLGMAARLYDKVSRGGITNVRMAQWKPDIVRVVLDLDGPHEYSAVRGEHDVKISVAGPSDFAAWRIGASHGAALSDVAAIPPAPAAVSAAPAPAMTPPVRTPAPVRTTPVGAGLLRR